MVQWLGFANLQRLCQPTGCANLPMGYSKLWGMPTYGVCQPMGYSKLWDMPTYGLCQPVGYANLWDMPTCGLCQPVGYSKLWAMPTYGLFQTMGNANLWGMPTNGLYQPMGLGLEATSLPTESHQCPSTTNLASRELQFKCENIHLRYKDLFFCSNVWPKL